MLAPAALQIWKASERFLDCGEVHSLYTYGHWLQNWSVLGDITPCVMCCGKCRCSCHFIETLLYLYDSLKVCNGGWFAIPILCWILLLSQSEIHTPHVSKVRSTSSSGDWFRYANRYFIISCLLSTTLFRCFHIVF